MVACFEGIAITKDELAERIIADPLLTDGQKEMAMNFLAYPPGRGRGKNATNDINRLPGIQICLNYLSVVQQYRQNLGELSDRSITNTRPLGGKSGIIRFRKNGSGSGSGKGKRGRPLMYDDRSPMPHPNTVISDEGIIPVIDSASRVTLRSQILEVLLHEMEAKDNHEGLSLSKLSLLFPDRTIHAIKSCVNKAVSQGHLKYNLKTQLYHL